MVARRRRSRFPRYAAPTAFLAFATAAIVLVATALHGGTVTHTGTTTTTAARPAPAPPTRTKRTRSKKQAPRPAGNTYTVVAGDTFGVIASKTGATVQQLEQLNPGVSSTSLRIGQTLHIP